ncbi:hypothetical protein [Alteromonas antoniana]|uniref:hypothetical protein n=1 Tax=Alteromonas antoniana TaxID=2803813 RepID=UPI001C47BAF0|nr:hypothetical protein [Alteromonas antoniana]
MEIKAIASPKVDGEYSVSLDNLIVVTGYSLEEANALVEKLKSDKKMAERMRAKRLAKISYAEDPFFSR